MVLAGSLVGCGSGEVAPPPAPAAPAAATAAAATANPEPAAPAADDTTTEALSWRAAAILSGALRGAGARVELADGGRTLKFDGHTLAAAVTIEKIVEEQGNVLAGIGIAVRVDGAENPALFAGGVGVGDTRAGAIETALQEWAMQTGGPIVQALRGPSSRRAPITVGAWDVHAGPTGIRGEKPEGATFDEAWQTSFLAHIDAVVRASFSGPGLHAMTLTIVVDGVGNRGECRVDGVVSPQLCERARSHAWPVGKDAYMFKQFYVLAPRA